MPGNSIVADRIAWLEDKGEDWVEEEIIRLGSVKALACEHWTAHSENDDAKPGINAFYKWLDKSPERKQEWWPAVKKRRAAALVEASQHDMDTSTPMNFRHRESKAKSARWLASKLDREQYGDGPQVQITNNTLEIGSVFAEALKQIADTRPVIEAKVEDE